MQRRGISTTAAADAGTRRVDAFVPAPAPVVVAGLADADAEPAVVELAARLAELDGGRLVLVHVEPPPLLAAAPQIAYAVGEPEPDGAARAAVARLARVAAGAGVAPRTELRVGFGELEARVAETAARSDAALIVVGAAAAARVLRRAHRPVVAVPDGAPAHTREGGDMSAILCGVDGSDDARLALRAAARLSGRLGSRLVVAHVVQAAGATSELGPTPGLIGAPGPLLASTGRELEAGRELLERMLEEEGLVDAERRVVWGFPADSLADVADEEDAELIVVGSRGRGPLRSAFLGSVSSDLIGVARRPVLVVPRAAAPATVAPERHAGAAPT